MTANPKKFSTNVDLTGNLLKNVGDGVVASDGANVGQLPTLPLAVTDGGTGAPDLPAYGVLVGAGSGAVVSVVGGPAGKAFVSGGASANPTWAAQAAAQFPGVSPNGVPSNVTRYFSLLSPASLQATDVISNRGLMARALTFQNLYVKVTTAPGGIQTVAFTLMLNGAPAALSCAISGGATSNSDVIHSFSCSAGDEVYMRAVSSPTAAATGAFEWGVEAIYP